MHGAGVCNEKLLLRLTDCSLHAVRTYLRENPHFYEARDFYAFTAVLCELPFGAKGAEYPISNGRSF